MGLTSRKCGKTPAKRKMVQRRKKMNSDTASRAARAALTKNAKLRHTFHTPRRGREIIDSWQYGPAATGPVQSLPGAATTSVQVRRSYFLPTRHRHSRIQPLSS